MNIPSVNDHYRGAKELIRQKGGENILVIGGGIIPKKDVPELKEAGIAQTFGPGTPPR